MSFSGISNGTSEETRIVYNLDYGGLKIEIIAPVEVFPGDNVTLMVNTSASGVEQIYIDYINLDLYGFVNSTTKIFLDQIAHLNNIFLASHSSQYNISIPDNIYPGLTFGEISCEWEVLGLKEELPPSGFVFTCINNVALTQLQLKYDELEANYTELESEYNRLETELNEEVGSTRSLMYIFVVTTVVGAITVFVLLLRKPKRIWI
jgi:hypothetical protein